MSDLTEISPVGLMGHYYQNVRTEIEPLLPDTLDSVLEIGCGGGATMKWVRTIRPVRYAAGVELFPAAAEVAKLVFDAVEVNDVNSAIYDFKERKFDTILALDILEHLADPTSIVRRLYDMLKPGGIFIASVPNIAHYSVSLPLAFRGLWEYKDSGLLDRTHLHFFTRKSALALITDAGLEIADLRIVWQGPNILGLGNHPSRAVRWYAKRISSLAFRWPRHMFAFQFLIAARRPCIPAPSRRIGPDQVSS